MKARIEPPAWIDRGHRSNTVLMIERTVEWVEARQTPFTTHECWNGAGVRWPTAYRTLLSLRRAGLVTCVNPGRMPPRYIRYDLAHRWS